MSQYGQDYKPKFRVGQDVIVHQGTATERHTTIGDRRVYRDQHHPKGDTFYEFTAGDGAWEWALTPVSDRVTPEVAMARIVDAFPDRLVTAELRTSTRWAHGVTIWHTLVTLVVKHVPDVGSHELIHLWTEDNNERVVETIGPWWVSYSNAKTSAENLGAAIVAAYNGTMSDA